MEHEMGLYEAPFNSMKSGRKKVEVRLNDEKRRKIKLEDKITFTKIPGEKESLTVEVTGLRKYPTFKELYENIPASDLDAIGDSIKQMVENTYQIYTVEQEEKWGVLAIDIKVFG